MLSEQQLKDWLAEKGKVEISKSKLFYDLQSMGWGLNECYAIIEAITFYKSRIETIE